MAPEHELHKMVGRKLTKKRRPLRTSSVKYPARLREGEDAQEDVTAAKGELAKHMNQSVFSMITAAGSKVDFHARFEEEESSDSDDESQASTMPGGVEEHSNHIRTQTHLDKQDEDGLRRGKRGTRQEPSAEHTGTPSLPKLDLRTIEEKDYMSQSLRLSSSALPNQRERPTGVTPRDAPVMSMMLQAQADLIPHTTLLDTKHTGAEDGQDINGKEIPTSLVTRLMETFGFEGPEEVVSEYRCWLLQSVLLQGYMYITQNHICFYSYLPKQSKVTAKSGHLFKRGRQTPKYHRYWFILKGDVLSYYADQSRLYFPSGNIDLRYGISASNKGKDFTIVTDQRVCHFKADSATSAKEWVKMLQRVIFRSHNDGDSVKISLPIENVIDVEESPVSGLAETIKIRVVDNDETYAVEEYFFSFFSFGHDAFNVLHTMVNDTMAQKIPHDILSPFPVHDDSRSRDNSRPARKGKPHDLEAGSPLDTATPILHDNIRATLNPFSPTGSDQVSPRVSGDWERRSIDVSGRSTDAGGKSPDFPARDASRNSLQRGRSSASTSRNRLTKRHPRTNAQVTAPQGSTDSFVHSLEQGTESSAPNLSSNETHASGSQILNRSDVFQSPTIQRLHGSPIPDEESKRRPSMDSARSNSIDSHVKNRPPIRSYCGQSGVESPQRGNPNKSQLSQSNSSPALHQLVKVGAYPLQRAAGLADYVRSRSKKMSNLLATESMGYMEKVSGMWAGGRKHYSDAEGVLSDDRLHDLDDENNPAKHGDRFRAHFALPASEKLQATYFAYLQRVLPLYGKLYVSNKNVCFRSFFKGTRTKMVLPLKDIETVDKEKGFSFGYSGLVVVIRGHEEIFFEFAEPEARDDCAITILKKLHVIESLQDSEFLTKKDKEEAETARAENKMLEEARQAGHKTYEPTSSERVAYLEHPQEVSPTFFDDPQASILNFKPTESLRITCLTIGSRGDVQPYIALCKRLLEEGHRPKIATHVEFRGWVTKHGIEFAIVDGDPAELMRICVENGMFTYSFLREASVKFRGWIDELLTSAWKACQDTDILIESPSAMAGIHIAEALGIPYFRAFAMPWTRTRAYPHAFAVPEHKMGGAYNYITYVMFDNIFWKATAGQINRWRKKELGLRSTSLDKLQPNKVPFLYNFSPFVVVPPIDFSDWIRVTGYWFLDEASDWSPPSALVDFIARARAEEKKIVYIGFGSIVVSDPAALTKTVVESVLKADVCCILSKGWSDRLGIRDATVAELPLPPEIYQITSAPHDWLFKQIDAAVHHGGAGTTGASLRAGLPTIIKPFFGDQFFFGSRVEDLGVGICMKKVNVSVFSRALWEATHSQRMIVKAKKLGEQIRQEDGVGTAIKAIYRDLEYAKTLIKHRTDLANDDTADGANDEWTFIGDESDPELARRIAEWEPRKSFQLGEGSGRRSLDLGA